MRQYRLRIYSIAPLIFFFFMNLPLEAQTAIICFRFRRNGSVYRAWVLQFCIFVIRESFEFGSLLIRLALVVIFVFIFRVRFGMRAYIVSPERYGLCFILFYLF